MHELGVAHAQRCGIAGRGGVNQQEWVLRGSVSFSVTWRRGFAQRRGLPLPPRRHSYGGTLKHKSPTPAGAGRGSSAAGREQQGDGMTVEELHDGRGEVLKHTSSALAGERTPLCTLCGMCRLQSNKGSDAHSDFRITILLLAEGRNCNPTKWRS